MQAHRETLAKKAIQEQLTQYHGPVTEVEIRQALVRQGLRVHKTTIYRQLAALVSAGWATVTNFADGVTRYERQLQHHHHVVCRSCKRVEEVHMSNHLAKEEAKIARARGFTKVTHVLEFFGTCHTCARRQESH